MLKRAVKDAAASMRPMDHTQPRASPLSFDREIHVAASPMRKSNLLPSVSRYFFHIDDTACLSSQDRANNPIGRKYQSYASEYDDGGATYAMRSAAVTRTPRLAASGRAVRLLLVLRRSVRSASLFIERFKVSG